jgi:hypothetical protein
MRVTALRAFLAVGVPDDNEFITTLPESLHPDPRVLR